MEDTRKLWGGLRGDNQAIIGGSLSGDVRETRVNRNDITQGPLMGTYGRHQANARKS